MPNNTVTGYTGQAYPQIQRIGGQWRPVPAGSTPQQQSAQQPQGNFPMLPRQNVPLPANPNAISPAQVPLRPATVPAARPLVNDPVGKTFTRPGAKWSQYDTQAQNGMPVANEADQRLAQMMGNQQIAPGNNRTSLGALLLSTLATAAPAAYNYVQNRPGASATATGGNSTSSATASSPMFQSQSAPPPQGAPIVFPSSGGGGYPSNGGGYGGGAGYGYQAPQYVPGITLGGPVAVAPGGGGGGAPPEDDGGGGYDPYYGMGNSFGSNSYGSNTPFQSYAGGSQYNGGNYMPPQTASPGPYADTQGGVARFTSPYQSAPIQSAPSPGYGLSPYTNDWAGGNAPPGYNQVAPSPALTPGQQLLLKYPNFNQTGSLYNGGNYTPNGTGL